jgi:hypothetical protein
MTRPLHFFGPPGVLAVFGGGGILTFLFFEKVLFGIHLFQEHGPLLVLGMMLFLFGLQVLAVGLIGELLMRTHFESRETPIYRVERIAGSSRDADRATAATTS